MSDLDLERQRRLTRIRRLSGILKWAVTLMIALLVITALLLVAAIIFPDALDAGTETIDFEELKRPISDIPLIQRIGLAALASLAFVLLIGATWHIRQIFDHFHKSDFFSPRALARVLAFGIWLIALGLLDLATEPAASVLTSMDLGENERIFEIEIDGGEFSLMILGSLMLLFGWILREAALIADENRQFI